MLKHSITTRLRAPLRKDKDTKVVVQTMYIDIKGFTLSHLKYNIYISFAHTSHAHVHTPILKVTYTDLGVYDEASYKISVFFSEYYQLAFTFYELYGSYIFFSILRPLSF